MSVMDYNLGRRYGPHSGHAFQDYYCDMRSPPYSLSSDGRAGPRGYAFVGPVSGNRGRARFERDESAFEGGPSRRRIAVAVSTGSSKAVGLVEHAGCFLSDHAPTSTPSQRTWWWYTMLTICDSALGVVRGRSDAAEILVMAWDATAVGKLLSNQMRANSIV
jgi:hypothetical protein